MDRLSVASDCWPLGGGDEPGQVIAPHWLNSLWRSCLCLRMMRAANPRESPLPDKVLTDRDEYRRKQRRR